MVQDTGFEDPDNVTCHRWTDEDTDEFVAKIIVGPMIGIALGGVMVILTSMPLCCGVMRAQGKIIAMIAIPLGILACLMPLFLSMNGCPEFVDNLCDSCIDNSTGKTACTTSDRKALSDGCHALGFLVAYLLAWGWAAILLGALAAGFGCCILCGCCKMKPETTYVDGQQTSA